MKIINLMLYIYLLDNNKQKDDLSIFRQICFEDFAYSHRPFLAVCVHPCVRAYVVCVCVKFIRLCMLPIS